MSWQLDPTTWDETSDGAKRFVASHYPTRPILAELYSTVETTSETLDFEDSEKGRIRQINKGS